MTGGLHAFVLLVGLPVRRMETSSMRVCISRRSGVGWVSGSGSWEPMYENKMNSKRNLLRTELLRLALHMFVWSCGARRLNDAPWASEVLGGKVARQRRRLRACCVVPERTLFGAASFKRC